MIDFKLLLLNSLFITGLFYCCDYELGQNGNPNPMARNILWFVKYWMIKKLPLWMCKPIVACPMCMASCWGLVFILPSINWSDPIQNIIQIVVYCVALCGLNRIIYHFT